MNKSWDMIPRILKGTKKIESRWEKNKCAPWGKIKRGENIYFKNAGEPIIARAKVDKLIEFENLSKKDVREILKKYGGKDGIDEPDLGKIVKWA